jgi:DNA-binding transcriptional LysR family regulator
MIDARRLRTLHAVATHGTVTAAAAVLGYSGPAVSQQLAALEREVGVSLTERDGRTLVLTPAAEVLLAHAEVLFAQLDAAEGDLAALRDEVSGRVTLACIPSASAAIVPAAWRALRDEAAHVRLDLVEMEAEESIPALHRRDVDIAVVHAYAIEPKPLDPTFAVEPLIVDPVWVAVPAAHPAAAGPEIALADLGDEPFVAARTGTRCADMTQRACALAGFVPDVVARATDFAVQLELVAAGIGVALVPELTVRHLPAGVRLVAPAEPLTRTLEAVSRRGGDRHPAVRLVLDRLVAAARDYRPEAAAQARASTSSGPTTAGLART